MQTEKCAKIPESSRFRPNPYQLFSHFNTDERTPTEFRSVNEKMTTSQTCDDCRIL